VAGTEDNLRVIFKILQARPSRTLFSTFLPVTVAAFAVAALANVTAINIHNPPSPDVRANLKQLATAEPNKSQASSKRRKEKM
jgi:hypothetical protein